MAVQELGKEELLRLFQSKARCRHTQRRAHQIWKLLLPYLTYAQKRDLGLGWVHVLDDSCDPAELDLICTHILSMWRGSKT
jgi:hypothetical protein